MKLFAVGLNHESAPVRLREAFVLDPGVKRALYQSLALSPQAELLFLSTCNRTEVYLYGTFGDVETVLAALAHRAGQDWPEGNAFFLEDEAAVRHVLHVAAGLRSQVLGDGQILNQLKEAYRLASEEDRVGTVLHRLMHTAFRAAKQVVTETALSQSAASISSLAVATAQAYFSGVSPQAGALEGCRVLLIGAGQMGLLTLQALARAPLASLTVVNRSQERAEEIARQMGAVARPWKERYEALSGADLVIVATGAHEPVLRAEAVPPRAGEQNPALLIDIAVPRNIDPAIGAVPGYTVLDLDALNASLVRTETTRQVQIPLAEAICEEALAEFVAWVFHQQALQPAILTLRETFEAIRLQEVERHARRFSEIDREQLDLITRSIVQKILAVPIVRLKDAAPNSLDLARRIELLHLLFARPHCEEFAPPSASAAPCPFEGGREDPAERPVEETYPFVEGVDPVRRPERP